MTRKSAVCAKPASAATRKALAAAEALCAQRGERLTDMRRAAYQELLEAGQPMGAYDLLQRLQTRLDKALAPPTVYRPLEFLVQQGLAHRLESTHAFVACDHPSDHHQALYLVCTACGSEAEVMHKISEGPGDCPSCAKPALTKQISAAGFRLSGGGWYETDFKTGDKKNIAGERSDGAGKSSADSGGTAAKADSAKKSDTKPSGSTKSESSKAS